MALNSTPSVVAAIIATLAAGAGVYAVTRGEPDVIVYGRRSCPYTADALRVLQENGIRYALRPASAGKMPDGSPIKYVPQIYVRGQHKGGRDKMDSWVPGFVSS